MDLRSGLVACGGPEDLLYQAAFAQLARHYRLPSSVGTFAPGAKTSDWQAGLENGLSGLMSLFAGADMLSGAGLLFAARVFALEEMVLDAEIFGLLRHLAAGLVVDDETLAVEVIDEVGPAGNFLAEDHTLAHMRELWQPRLFDRGTWEEWEAQGRQAPRDRARERARSLLACARPSAAGRRSRGGARTDRGRLLAGGRGGLTCQPRTRGAAIPGARSRARGRALRAGQGIPRGPRLRREGRDRRVRPRGRPRRRAAHRRRAQAPVHAGPRAAGRGPARDRRHRVPRGPGRGGATPGDPSAVPAPRPRAPRRARAPAPRRGPRGPRAVSSAARPPALGAHARGASPAARRSDARWGLPGADHDRLSAGGAPPRRRAPRGSRDGLGASPGGRGSERAADPCPRRLRVVRAGGAWVVPPAPRGPRRARRIEGEDA